MELLPVIRVQPPCSHAIHFEVSTQKILDKPKRGDFTYRRSERRATPLPTITYLVIAGDYRDVVGGVKATLMRFLSGRDERIRFVGRLSDPELDVFYRFIDVLALPSIDQLEAYGMVQVEAMMRGRPVVATDLPGVRTIVQRTGMGQIVRRRDPHVLAQALERVLYEHAFTPRTPTEIAHLLDLGDTTSMYEDLFRKVADGEQV